MGNIRIVRPGVMFPFQIARPETTWRTWSRPAIYAEQVPVRPLVISARKRRRNEIRHSSGTKPAFILCRILPDKSGRGSPCRMLPDRMFALPDFSGFYEEIL